MSEQAELGTAVAEVVEPAPVAKSEEVSGLVELALTQGVDVKIIEKLVELQERVADRDSRSALTRALAKFQTECPSIHKSQSAKIATNAGAGYSYTFASLDDIAKVVRPILHVYGLSYTWDSEVREKGHLRVICTVAHIDGASVSALFECPIESQTKTSGAQKVGAALTYARRQSLVQVLGLTTTDDDTDGVESVSGETINKKQLADIEALLSETGADRGRFLEYVGVSKTELIPESAYGMAVRTLEAKRGA